MSSVSRPRHFANVLSANPKQVTKYQIEIIGVQATVVSAAEDNDRTNYFVSSRRHQRAIKQDESKYQPKNHEQ